MKGSTQWGARVGIELGVGIGVGFGVGVGVGEGVGVGVGVFMASADIFFAIVTQPEDATNITNMAIRTIATINHRKNS